jgi:hypothetical protein
MLTSVRVPVSIDTYSVQAQLEEGTRVRGSEPARGIAYGSTTAQRPNRCFGRLRTDIIAVVRVRAKLLAT